MSAIATPRLLVDVHELQSHLTDPSWCIVDVRHDLMDPSAGRLAYEAGHVAGAVFAHIDDDLSGTKTGRNGRHPLPERAALEERFRAWGISNDTRIVAYDAQGGQFAVRLWWLARWLGHANVALLDGGWPRWQAHSGPVSTSVPQRPRGTFVARPPLMPLVTSEQVRQVLASGERRLFDARTAERYRGEQEPIDPVAGHIPGARNRPWLANLNPDQTFKSPQQLRAEWSTALHGLPPERAIHHCGSGVTACHHVFALELAGLPGSALYGGSWSEWIADPTRPVATGDEP